LPIFLPPTVDEGPAGGGRLFSRYKITRGESVVKNGATYTRVRTPTETEKAALIAANIGVTESNFL